MFKLFIVTCNQCYSMKYYGPRQIKKLRHCFSLLLFLHLILLVERIIIDGFGHIYLLIILNVITAVFVVCGVVGLLKYQVKLLLAYVVWLVLWIGFNVFVITLYLNIGKLSHKNNWLSLQYNEQSWFRENGIGCKVNDTMPIYADMRVTDCVMKYEHMEIIQACLQILISLINLCMSCWLACKLSEDDDEDTFGFVGGFDPLSARVAPTRSSHPKIKYLEDDEYEI